MTEAAVLNTVNVGVEVTPGTPVATTRTLQATQLQPQFEADNEEFRPSGFAVNTIVIPNRERTALQLTGKPTFHEIVYWLSTLLDQGEVTTPGGATDARNWQFIPSADAEDEINTFTVEMVGVDSSDRMTYAALNQIGFQVSRSPGGSSIDLSGTMFAQPMDLDITPAGTPTPIPVVPMTPRQFSLYIDDSAANLGNTQFTDSFMANWQYGPKHMLKESLDSSEPSFTSHYRIATASTLEVRLEKSPAAVAYINSMRAAETLFLRLHGEGDVDAIESGATWEFMLDFAGKIVTPNRGEEDELVTLGLTFTNVYDATWEQSLEVNVVNDLASL